MYSLFTFEPLHNQNLGTSELLRKPIVRYVRLRRLNGSGRRRDEMSQILLFMQKSFLRSVMLSSNVEHDTAMSAVRTNCVGRFVYLGLNLFYTSTGLQRVPDRWTVDDWSDTFSCFH